MRIHAANSIHEQMKPPLAEFRIYSRRGYLRVGD
jgi:hypothetical protein